MKYISMNRAGLIAAIIVVASGVLGATPFFYLIMLLLKTLNSSLILL